MGNKTLLQYKIDSLHRAGIKNKQIVIVVGYLKDQVENSFPKVTIIENSEYATRNNMYSLWLAREYTKNGFILLNADTWHSGHIFDKAFSFYRPDSIKLSSFILVDSKKKNPEDLCAVVNEKGIVTKVEFGIKPENIVGKSAQFSRFSTADAKVFLRYIENCLSKKEYSLGANVMPPEVLKMMEFKIIDIGGLPWVEVDTIRDLEAAREVVLQNDAL